jgi:hypothetical protein
MEKSLNKASQIALLRLLVNRKRGVMTKLVEDTYSKSYMIESLNFILDYKRFRMAEGNTFYTEISV